MKDSKPWATALAYLTNRAIMNRLDGVCGPERWRNEYKEWNIGGEHGVLCGLSIKVNDEWITKWDGAENTDIQSIKGGLSDSMKRAAVQWGIGRYLYNLDETFVDCTQSKKDGYAYAKGKNPDKTEFTFYWKSPTLPAWAKPGAAPESMTKAGPQRFAVGGPVLASEEMNAKVPTHTVEKVIVTMIPCKTIAQLDTIYKRACDLKWSDADHAKITEKYEELKGKLPPSPIAA